MIPLFEPLFDDEEIRQLTDVINSKWIAEGEKTREFSRQIAALCGVEHAIAVSSGTIALYVALKALGIKPDDEVIVPDFTFIASANAVKLTGATPVFVDVDKNTFNIDAECAERAITSRTRAIMPVHIYGQAADMDCIGQLARSHNLYVIEDAAQAIGVTFDGKPAGSFGDIGCISFYADKTITTGEGGIILTDDANLAEFCKLFKNQGRFGGGEYVHPHIGYNFRLSDLNSAVGLAQLSKLSDIIRRRRENEKLYREILAAVNGIEFPYIDPRSNFIPWRVNILVKDPEGLSSNLKKQGVATRRFFYPLHRQPCYKTQGEFPNADGAYNRGLSLPSSPNLIRKQIVYICKQIKTFIGARK